MLRLTALKTWLLVLVGLSLVGHQIVWGQEEWQVGAIVGLRAGTCIREGPGLGYRAHTRVPEDDWAVQIIDGPRVADGKVWWDTSRRAAGDPSGGTGWVMQDQTDTDCPLLVAPAAYPSPSLPATSSWQEQITTLWWSLPDWARWGVAVMLLLVGLRIAGSAVMGLLGALLQSIFIAIVMDLTRSFWHPLWLPIGHSIFGSNAPDLTLLLAVLPLAYWLISAAGRLLRRI